MEFCTQLYTLIKHNTIFDKSYGVLMKQAPVAPIWARIGLSYIVFREESEYGTPGAQFQRKTTKNREKPFFDEKG